jgi:hypothetical protein
MRPSRLVRGFWSAEPRAGGLYAHIKRAPSPRKQFRTQAKLWFRAAPRYGLERRRKGRAPTPRGSLTRWQDSKVSAHGRVVPTCLQSTRSRPVGSNREMQCERGMCLRRGAGAPARRRGDQASVDAGSGRKEGSAGLVGLELCAHACGPDKA